MAYAMLNHETILIILVIVVILFGGSKIPELARGLGQGMKEFKQAAKDEGKSEDKPATTDTTKSA